VSDGTPARNHLTSGGILKGILALAGPMFISAQLQNLQSLIDLYWVGRLGSNAVAAISISGTTLMLLFPIVMAMSAGTLAFVSRHVGAGRSEDAAAVAGQALLVSILVGLVAGLAAVPAAGCFCRMLGAAPAIADAASPYLQISFAASFTEFALFTASSAIQGAGNTVIPMIGMALANVLNLVLDPLLIYGLGPIPAMGISGAALATVLAQGLAACILIRHLRSGVLGVPLSSRHFHLRRATALGLLSTGLPAGGQMLSRSLMSLLLMRIVASCGTLAIAAYGIGMRFHMIILMPSFALGNAAATMVGQNLGAGKPDRSNRAAWYAAGLASLITAAAAAIAVVMPQWLIGFFSKDPHVTDIGVAYLRTVSFCYIGAAVSIVLSRALMGAGDTMASMVLTIVCLWGIQVPLAILLRSHVSPPTSGIWMAVAIALVSHGVLTSLWFLTGRWKTHRMAA
jgi:putative MATE family efflux protein